MRTAGDILEMDLTSGRSTRRCYPDEVLEKVLAGRGYNASLLLGEVTPETNPLGPKNVLVLCCGLLTGTTAPVSSRVHLGALSPLTGLLGSSSIGGDIGAAFRSQGVQALVLRGKAPRPACLVLFEGAACIESAEDLWGLDTVETQEILFERYGAGKTSVLAIGPAGENRVRFACAMTDRDHAAGRTGIGAVMGSKNLKAVVVCRTASARTRLAPEVQRAFRSYVRGIRESPEFETFRTYGGAGYIQWCNELGLLGTRNYRRNRFEEIDGLDGRRLHERVIKTRGCRGCPVRCKAVLRFQGNASGSIGARPEFESMVSLGANCGLSDLETVIRLDNLCSRLGMDSISAGSAVAFAMDLYDRGLLTRKETGGLDLTWGQGEAMEILLERMARREGLGAILAEGVRRAASMIGRGSERFAPHVKGLELSAYHPGHIMGTALGYMVSSRGGDFSSVYPSLEYAWSTDKLKTNLGIQSTADFQGTEGKALLVKRAVIVSLVLDCLGLCKVPVLSIRSRFDLEAEAELARAVTGREWNAEELMAIGKRVADLERRFNLAHGARMGDDRLPTMFFLEGNGDHKNGTYESMLHEFYRLMAWDEQGRPESGDYDPEICSSRGRPLLPDSDIAVLLPGSEDPEPREKPAERREGDG